METVATYRKKDLTVMVSEFVDVSPALSDGVINLAVLEALHVSP